MRSHGELRRIKKGGRWPEMGSQRAAHGKGRARSPTAADRKKKARQVGAMPFQSWPRTKAVKMQLRTAHPHLSSGTGEMAAPQDPHRTACDRPPKPDGRAIRGVPITLLDPAGCLRSVLELVCTIAAPQKIPPGYHFGWSILLCSYGRVQLRRWSQELRGPMHGR